MSVGPRIVLCNLLIFALISLLGAETEPDLLAEGKAHLEGGRWNEALVPFDLVKQQDPTDIRPYIHSAKAMLKAGRSRDAEMELRLTLSLKTTDSEQVIDLAKAFSEAGSLRLASDVLENSGELGQSESERLWLMADLYYRQRRFQEANLALNGYIQRPDIDLMEAHLKRGQILLEDGELERSMEAFEKVVDINSHSAAGYHGLSKVCQIGNNPEAAKRMSQEAVRYEPNNAIYVFQLGITHKIVGDYTEAVKHLEESRRLGADPFGVSFELGDAYRKAGQMDAARKELSEYQKLLAERRKEQEITQLLNQGEEALQSGKAEEAEAVFKRILQLDPDQWVAHNRLAKINLASGSFNQTYTHLNRLLELDENNSETHFLLAAYWYRSNATQAFEHAQISKTLRPGNADLRNLLGNILVKANKRELALEEYRAAMNLAPDRSEFRANYQAIRRKIAP